MPDIILTTLNARYAHCAFGLRYLLANLGELRSRARLLEFDLSHQSLEVAEAILAQQPRIVGLGVYIWNALPSTQLVADLKRLRPDLVVVLGGPEVSHESDQPEIVRLADYVITGEADLAFADLCRTLLAAPADRTIPTQSPRTPHPSPKRPGAGLSLTGRGTASPSDSMAAPSPLHAEGEAGRPAAAGRTGEGGPLSPPVSFPPKIIAAPPPDFDRLALPYELYTDDDLAHRVVYVEASRGCPFECEFCLSALSGPVREAPLEPFLAAMQSLLDRGAPHFKFVDRTFNLDLKRSEAILRFFLERHRPGRLVHVEMIPDRMPTSLRDLLRRFPPGALQFEVGIQTFNPEVAARIHRRQDDAAAADNLRFLRAETGVHVHADLIVGLPGETIESFGAGFDRLVGLRPQEIQVGLLKRLRGALIARHDAEWDMVYSPFPPYEILQNRLIDFFMMQRLRRFARYWDLVGNSGRFLETAPLIWGDGSAFRDFLRFSDWLYDRTGQTHAIALPRLSALVGRYLTEVRRLPESEVSEVLTRDQTHGGRTMTGSRSSHQRRQSRHGR